MAAKIEYDAGIWPLLEEVSQSLVDQNHIRIPQFELTLQDLVSDATMRLLWHSNTSNKESEEQGNQFTVVLDFHLSLW